MARLLSLVIFGAVVSTFGIVDGKKKLKEQEIIQRALKDYDWRVRPRGVNDTWPDTGGPVVVKVNIYLRSISKIDDVNMEYSVQFTFREEWRDARLAYGRFSDEDTDIPPFVVLATSEHAGLSQQIWMPDSFFQNEKEARRHLIDKPNVLIRIHPNGDILYSVRLSLVLSCPMSLEYYPLDRQTCLIDLASYAYTTDDIKYEWKAVNPIQQKAGLRQSLPSFELQDVLTAYCTSKTNTGEYSCARVKLLLRREYSYYLIQLYIPCIMLVVVSWVSFWLDKDAVPARVSLGVTTLLTQTTQSSGINSKLPPVSYIKAVDSWIGTCLAFIFCALIEYALVNYYGRVEFLRKEKQKKLGTGLQAPINDCLCPPPPAPNFSNFGTNSPSPIRLDMQDYPKKSIWSRFKLGGYFFDKKIDVSKRIDYVSRFTFPTLFCTFLVYYYIKYVREAELVQQ
uniref:Ig-like domain-containing protein n=1 Tax=Panagrellus redivivus TaxID=6233 RepID=A0A7E4ZSR1_PANRE